MGFVDVARDTDHIPVFAQVADMPPQLHLRHEIDVRAVDGRSAHGQIVAVADITQNIFDFGTGAVGIEQGVIVLVNSPRLLLSSKALELW